MSQPKNSIIRQYTAMFMSDEKKLKFTEETLKYVAHVANNIGTGARALRSVLETLMRDYTFNCAGDENKGTVMVDRDYAERVLTKRFSTYAK